MSNDDEPTGRDLRVMWQTVTVAAVVIGACIGGLVYAVVWATRLTSDVEALQKWQVQKDRDASRELWRRDRQPLPPPKG